MKNEMIGKKFGLLTVIREKGRTNHGSKRYDCICTCGKIKNCAGQYLKQGKIKSCGCMWRIWISQQNEGSSLVGQTFGHLKVLYEVSKHKNQRCFMCKCSCGKLHSVLRRSLLSGTTKSCGHLRNK